MTLALKAMLQATIGPQYELARDELARDERAHHKQARDERARIMLHNDKIGAIMESCFKIQDSTGLYAM